MEESISVRGFPPVDQLRSQPGAVSNAGAERRADSRRTTLQSLTDIDGGIQLAWLVTVEVEANPKPALVAETLQRLYGRFRV